VTRRSRADEHEEFYRTQLGKDVLDEEVRLLMDRLPERGRVLSAGCGIGVHEATMQARRPELQVLCLDLQREMVALVPAGLHALQGDMTALPFPDGTFDGAFVVTALELVPEPAVAVAELARVLRPGGALVLLALNPVSQWGRDRLRQLPATWGTLEDLVAMVEAAMGSPADVEPSLNLEGDVLREAVGMEDAALLVVTARVPS